MQHRRPARTASAMRHLPRSSAPRSARRLGRHLVEANRRVVGRSTPVGSGSPARSGITSSRSKRSLGGELASGASACSSVCSAKKASSKLLASFRKLRRLGPQGRRQGRQPVHESGDVLFVPIEEVRRLESGLAHAEVAIALRGPELRGEDGSSSSPSGAEGRARSPLSSGGVEVRSCSELGVSSTGSRHACVRQHTPCHVSTHPCTYT